jgi:hypothetical protein
LRSLGLRPIAEVAEHRSDHGWSRRRNCHSALGWETVAVGNAPTGWGVRRGELVEGLDLQREVAAGSSARKGE